MPCIDCNENCFDGCSDIVSDKCVKYTGPDVVALNIHKGDDLQKVDSVIISTLLASTNGSVIIPQFDYSDLCAFINTFFPTAGVITLNDNLRAAFLAICSLKATMSIVENKVGVIDTPYTVGCLTGITDTSSTHQVLQALILKACLTASEVATVSSNMSNYVLISQINGYIASYIASTGTATLMNTKMVPYAVQEYYGPITMFDASGAGTGNWVKIYLCNGDNGTPDKRGRVGVGVTAGGGLLSPTVDPAISGNPSYSLGTAYGSNFMTLDVSQIPGHNHTASVSDPGHTHDFTISGGDDTASTGNHSKSRHDRTDSYTTQSKTTGISVSIGSSGGGLPHPNIQPSLGCYYIQYRP